jgi:hypothetical protein
MRTQIETLHALYNQITGFNLVLAEYGRERFWYEFLKKGFTEPDLRLVLTYIKQQIKAGKKGQGSLRFSYLIERPDMFEEERAFAKTALLSRKPQPTEKEKVIQVFRPQVAESTLSINCKPVRDIMPKLFEQMRKSAE